MSRLFKAALLLLMLLPVPAGSAAAQSDPAQAVVRGQLQWPETTGFKGVAALWDAASGRAPDPQRYTIIPFMAAPLQADGSFELQVRAGRYYVGAILRRSSGPLMGPPRPGDVVFMTPGPGGGKLEVAPEAGQIVELGVRTDGWVFSGPSDEEGTAVVGRVVDRQGAPVAGVLVFGFTDPALSEKPLAVSTPTDAQGRYLLRLDRPATVYLRVKDSYAGGAPGEGDRIGVYGGAVPHPVEVAEGRHVDGVDIIVLTVPEGQRLRQERSSQPQR